MIAQKAQYNEPVSIESRGKICLSLGCTANNIVEFLPDEQLQVNKIREQ